MVLEYTNSAASGKVYVYGLTLISQGNSLYYIYNAHGDVVKYINASGTVLRNYEYDAFGEEVTASATDANPFRYAGQYYDSETGTYYLRARYYSPALGRFTQADKHWNTGNMLYGDDPLMLTQYIAKPDMLAIAQSVNLYVYCIDNPVAYVDETGELVWPGEIHNAVSNHIIWTQGLYNKRYIQPNKFVRYDKIRFGFADLYDSVTGEVWEIKPNKAKYKISGPKQLQKYIDNIEGASAGKSLGNGKFYYISQGKTVPLFSIYEVTYTSDDMGMIYYHSDPIFDPDEYTLVLITMLAMMLAGTYNGSTIPIPSGG